MVGHTVATSTGDALSRRRRLSAGDRGDGGALRSRLAGLGLAGLGTSRNANWSKRPGGAFPKGSVMGRSSSAEDADATLNDLHEGPPASFLMARGGGALFRRRRRRPHATQARRGVALIVVTTSRLSGKLCHCSMIGLESRLRL